MSIWSRIERRLSDFAGELLPDEHRQRITAARDLLERGLAEDAAEILALLLDHEPEHAGALSLLGAAQLDMGKAGDAVGSFGRALASRPDMPEALVGLGEANLALDQWQNAIESFRAAAGAARGDRAILSAAYRGLGLAYRRAGDLEKAIRELRKAVAESADDPVARAALGEALLVDERVSAEEARRHLELAMAADAPPALAFLAMGRIALDEDEGERALSFFTQALDSARTRARSAGAAARREELTAHIGLGDAALALGDPHRAHQHYLQALDLDRRNAEVQARIGDVHRRVGNMDMALSSYELSLTLRRDPAVLRRALDAAIETEAMDAAVRLANDVLADDPDDARAMVARGMAFARQDNFDAARGTFAAALRHGEDPEAHLAIGRLELAADPGRAGGARAAAAALAALQVEPDHPRARRLLADARARELGEIFASSSSSPSSGEGGEGGEGGEKGADDAGEDRGHVAPDEARADASGMYVLAERFGRLAQARSELADLAGQAARAAADFDQPLLVTVMGEFSSGKSSFVNAFIGDEVAPTGITPTTATINIVKYGRERGGRILYRDGTIVTLSWNELFPELSQLGERRARAVEVVEILLPLAQLERVNIVDTPGLNSILPEHEETARGFIARADAVVWLFTASQAGKASERKALESIRNEGKRVLGVLNKKDQLSDSEAAELVDYVQGELSELVELVVPLSARFALDHKRAKRDDDGNWGALATALEQRFFAQARQLKRDACSRRLAGLLARARSVVAVQEQRAAGCADALRRDADGLLDAGAAFIDRVVVEQRVALSSAVEELHRRAAREVLELVRPRELPFGSHSATPADRDYLLSLLDTGYEAALERARRQVSAVLRQHKSDAITAIARAADLLGPQAVGDMTRTAEDALRLVEAQVFDRTRAYLRGYLRGGYVSSFFRRDLPKLELDEDSVYQALVRDSPNLDAEIALRLASAGTAAIEAMARRLEHWAGVAGVMAYDIEAGVGRALEALDERRQRLTGAPNEQQ
jgi:tetratricopeptide (TPR) repeat protein/GTP-binding protein EngB required for normal cell division